MSKGSLFGAKTFCRDTTIVNLGRPAGDCSNNATLRLW